MLHHTRISIGNDDVTMLRLELFFFHTLRLRHTQVNIWDSGDFTPILALNYFVREIPQSTFPLKTPNFFKQEEFP